QFGEVLPESVPGKRRESLRENDRPRAFSRWKIDVSGKAGTVPHRDQQVLLPYAAEVEKGELCGPQERPPADQAKTKAGEAQTWSSHRDRHRMCGGRPR